MPRKTVPIYLLDQGEGEDLGRRAAEVLLNLGYTNLHIVSNGVAGWQAAGLEIFSGVNVPSKAFGEFVEHRFEAIVTAHAWLHHFAERAVFGMFRGDFKIATHVMSDQLFDILRGFHRKVVAQA